MNSIDTIREAFERVLEDIENMENDGIIGGVSDDIIYVKAREALAALSTIEADALTVESVNAGLDVGLNGEQASKDSRDAYRSNPFTHRIADTIRYSNHDDAIRRECAEKSKKAIMGHGKMSALMHRSFAAQLAEQAILGTEPALEDKQEYYWWCPECNQEVDGSRVTFEENHDTCGCRVIVKAEPARDDSEPCIFDWVAYRNFPSGGLLMNWVVSKWSEEHTNNRKYMQSVVVLERYNKPAREHDTSSRFDKCVKALGDTVE